jgi:RraA family protein
LLLPAYSLFLPPQRAARCCRRRLAPPRRRCRRSPANTQTNQNHRTTTAHTNSDFGGRTAFHGQAHTIKCRDSNPLVRKALMSPGQGRVLVVDGGGSLACALLGDNLAAAAVTQGWAGIIIHGCIRDAEGIGRMPLGVKALASHPLKSAKSAPGEEGVALDIGGARVEPGDWIYADADGVLVSRRHLSL